MQLRYLLRELLHRPGRAVATSVSIALASLLAIAALAVADAYSTGLQQPLRSVGAGMIVQLTGGIPPKLEGIVFPHPNAMLPPDGVMRIEAEVDGAVRRAVYMWDIAPSGFISALGVDVKGLDRLDSSLEAGRRPAPEASGEALLDGDYARRLGKTVGSTVAVGGKAFTVTGIVDSALTGKVFRADVYMPLSRAQGLAAASPQVGALYPFTPNDVNLLLVDIEHENIERLTHRVREILGSKAVVSSEMSLRDAIEGVFFLSRRMGVFLATVVGVFAFAVILRATATSVNERRTEVAVLQGLGWPWSAIRMQLVAETLVLAGFGALLGTVGALAVLVFVGAIDIAIDLPWDITSTPHFLAEAQVNRQQLVSIPLEVPIPAMAATWAAAVATSALAVLIAVGRARASPWHALSDG